MVNSTKKMERLVSKEGGREKLGRLKLTPLFWLNGTKIGDDIKIGTPVAQHVNGGWRGVKQQNRAALGIGPLAVK